MDYFIKDTSQLRTATGGGVAENFTFSDIQSQIEEAAIRYLRNNMGIGDELFDSLFAAFNDSAPPNTQAYARAIQLIQRIAGNFALYHWLDTGTITIGSSGAAISKEKDAEAPKMWMINKNKNARIISAFEAFEVLFDHLEVNSSYFLEWKSSEARTYHHATLITDVAEFNSYYPQVNSRRTFAFIKNELLHQASTTIANIISQSLYEEILSKTLNNTLTTEHKNLLAYIKPALVFNTMAQSFNSLSFVIDEKGLQVMGANANSDNFQTAQSPSDLRIKELAIKASQRAANLNAALVKYLFEHADDFSSTYKASTQYTEREKNMPKGNQSENSFFYV